MTNLIDREELLNNRPEYLNPQMKDEIASARHQGWNDCNSYYYNLIIKQPTVDTERHATWIKTDDDNFICSNCRSDAPMYKALLDYDNDYYEILTDFCPNCGYKMIEVSKCEKVD